MYDITRVSPNYIVSDGRWKPSAKFKKKKCTFHRYYSLVHILSNQSSKSESVISLVKPLMLVSLKYTDSWFYFLTKEGIFQVHDTCSRHTTSAYSGAIPDIPLLTEIEPLFSAPMSINMSETYRVGTQTFVRHRVRYGLSLV